jgi:galactokinase
MDIQVLIESIGNKKLDTMLMALYGGAQGKMNMQRRRYFDAVVKYGSIFPENNEVHIFSTPGRTEVGGNHTDHNAGHVLAAAVDLDVVAVAALTASDCIRVHSEGYEPISIRLDDLEKKEAEQYTSAALIRGVCARLRALGWQIGGFDACVTSTVLKASGLSSSAAFEVLTATILNHFYNDGRIDDITIARIAQYAENNYFGKPCGLMDQTTCSVGGFVTIDFQDFDNPIVRKVRCDFAASGYAMVIVDTGGNHADLNEDYAALEHEMKEVARAFGGEVLRQFSLEKVRQNIAYLRTKVNDRAILRAFHFYYDDERVSKQAEALENGDMAAFMQMVIESGEDSWMLCQNCYSHTNIKEQGVSVALAISEYMLKGCGAWRVHGGGFAGTIQAFVPLDKVAGYVEAMRAIYGESACYELMIRPSGSIKIV